MRQFYIQNEYGQRIELQGGSIFMWEPSGWGFEDDINYEGADGFFVETFREQVQVEKSATLVFKPNDAYKDYREFADWIFAAKALTLAYNPYGEWYFVDVDITRMEKAELTLYRTLEIPVVYKPKSPIYTPYDLNLVIEGEGDTNSKRYPYRYPYRYSDSSLAGVLEFTVPAQMPCAFNLTIPGEIQAPILTAKRMDTGELLGRVDLSSVSADKGESLFFSNVPGNSGAKLLTQAGEVDLTAQIGLSMGIPAFFRLPPNVPIQFALAATSLVGVNAAVRIFRYYRTV